jgi:hypothetical protein
VGHPRSSATERTAASIVAVWTGPGDTVLAVTPVPARALASDTVMFTIAALAAA